jgi:hypothetical protein
VALIVWSIFIVCRTRRQSACEAPVLTQCRRHPDWRSAAMLLQQIFGDVEVTL